MELPTHVQTAIGVRSPVSEDDLAAAADAWPGTETVFGLSGREFADAAARAHANRGAIAILKPKRINPTSWNYLELNSGGSFEGWFLTTPNRGVGSPPTAVGQALVAAWLSEPTVMQAGVLPGLLLREIPANGTLPAFASDLAAQWCEACFFLHDANGIPLWITRGKMDIGPDSRLISPEVGRQYQRLFLEVVSETKDKWRFLSLYRVLEHGYLNEVFETLKGDFFGGPEAALTTALKMIGSELNQFIALAERTSLQDGFENFFDEFERVKNDGNKLAFAIERSIKQAGQQHAVNGQWQMGVLLCYKLRCSIVHAGPASPVFDTYDDGPALLEAMLPTCESIGLNFLNVTLT